METDSGSVQIRCRLFISELKRTDIRFSVDEKCPLTIDSLCRHCIAIC